MQSKRIIIDGCETDYVAYETGQILYERTREFVEPEYYKSRDPEVTLWFRREPHVFVLKNLIADCFLPNPYNLPFVDYLTNDVTDNSIYNIIRSGNTNRARANYSPEQIHRVCQLIVEDKLPVNKIASETGVDRHVIKRIKFYNGWPHIAKQYGIVCEKQDTVWSPDIRKKLKELYYNDMTLNSRDVAKILGVPVTRRFCLAARGVKLEVHKRILAEQEAQNESNNI